MIALMNKSLDTAVFLSTVSEIACMWEMHGDLPIALDSFEFPSGESPENIDQSELARLFMSSILYGVIDNASSVSYELSEAGAFCTILIHGSTQLIGPMPRNVAHALLCLILQAAGMSMHDNHGMLKINLMSRELCLRISFVRAKDYISMTLHELRER